MENKKLVKLEIRWSHGKMHYDRTEYPIVKETEKTIKAMVGNWERQFNKQYDLNRINTTHANITQFSFEILSTLENEDKSKALLNAEVNSLVKKSSDAILALAELGDIYKI